MGAVYEAVDQRLDITVALKETVSTEPSVRKQFEREARLLASLTHPALPRVSDHFTEHDRAFLVMQFIGGVDLARIIAQQPGPFPRAQVIAWADQLLDALMYLHSRDRQVIHRDIKPHNLKLTASGQIALLDFGLARAQTVDASSTASGAFFGYTRQYAPLEQIEDRQTDPRSDIYALGATLYHLLTGVKPPDSLARAAAIIQGDRDLLRPADQIHQSVGPEIAAILMKAMAQEPEQRYASASEFRDALRNVGRRRRESSELTEDEGDRESLKMDMVVSRRRFGPGSATALVVAMFMIAATVLYGSDRWFNSRAKTISTSTRMAAKTITPASVESRQSDELPRVKPKLVNSGVGSSAQVKDAPQISRKNEGLRRGKSNRLNAPAIRLPEADLTW
jgi:serine/threonine protein kinase